MNREMDPLYTAQLAQNEFHRLFANPNPLVLRAGDQPHDVRITIALNLVGHDPDRAPIQLDDENAALCDVRPDLALVRDWRKEPAAGDAFFQGCHCLPVLVCGTPEG